MKYRQTFILIAMFILLPSLVWAQKIHWQSYSQGIRQAQKQDKKIFLHFATNWCGYCKKMDRTTFRDTRVIDYLNQHFISIKVDGDREKDLARKFKVTGFPDTRFLDKNMNQAFRLPGFVDPMAFGFFMEYVTSDAYKTMDPMAYYKSRQ